MSDKKIIFIIRFVISAIIVSVFIFYSISLINRDKGKTLVVGWFDFPVADIMPEITKDFTERTGINVVFKKLPTDKWEQEFFNNVCSADPDYDLFVGDSQWIGHGAENNCYEELTDFVKKNKVVGRFVDFSVKSYGEFPANSERYYAIPFSGNAFIYAYRKDWLENEKEKKNFYERYGYELSYPRTTHELRDVAEFFTRPEENKYGIIFMTSPTYDSITMEYGTFLFGAGGSWGDYGSCQTDGYINSETSIKTLELFKELVKYMPKQEAVNYGDVTNGFMEGNVAVMGSVAARGLDVTNHPKYKSSDIGWFGTLFGIEGGYSQLAGQGISISKESSHKSAAYKFIDWWVTEETQKAFAKGGGFTLEKKAVFSYEFDEISPFNSSYSDVVEHMKDFWNIPSYNKMLAVSQKYLYEYVYDKNALSAKESLDKINEEWEGILDEDPCCQ